MSTDAGEEYEWVPDKRWRVGGDGRNCRSPRCPHFAVASIDRSNTPGVTRWWYYCHEHMYGRLIDGVVCYLRRIP